MGAQILAFPDDPTGTRDARLILARSWSSDAELHQARMHILTYGSAADRAFARRATRERSLRQARLNAARFPMPAAVAASLGRDETARSEGNQSLPAKALDCSALGATASAEAMSAAEAFSLKAERHVTQAFIAVIVLCLTFLGGAHLGGAITSALISTL